MRILRILFIAAVLLVLAKHPNGTIAIQLTDGGPAYVRTFLEEISYPGAQEIRITRRGSTVEIDILDGGSPSEYVRFILSLTA